MHVAETPTWAQGYETWVRPLLAQEDVAGLAVAMAQEGRPVYFAGFGHRDRARDLPVTEHTVFGIGSITKSFTAMAIMQLAEAGRLDVHDTAARHIPELRVAHAAGPTPIEIRHLMSHSAGLAPLPTLRATLVPSLRADPDVKDAVREKLPEAVTTWEEMIAFLNRLDSEPLGAPGEVFSYSNDGYALLGLIVERASGERYEDYVTRHILEPAGMTESGFDVSAIVHGPDTTRLYNRRKGEDGRQEAYDAGPWWDAGPMTAAGFLRASARDMLRYLEIYRTGGMVGERRILSQESVREMTTPRIACDANMTYGYGLMLTADHGGVRLIEHGGNIKGAAAWVSVVPERGLTAVGLSNLSGAPTSRALLGALNAAIGLDPSRLRAEFARPYTPTAPLQDYTGRFASGEDTRFAVTEADGQLTVTYDEDGDEPESYVLRPVEADGFVVEAHGDQSFLRFLRGGDGQVVAVASHFRVVRKVLATATEGVR